MKYTNLNESKASKKVTAKKNWKNRDAKSGPKPKIDIAKFFDEMATDSVEELNEDQQQLEAKKAELLKSKARIEQQILDVEQQILDARKTQLK